MNVASPEQEVNSVLKQSNSLKRRCDEVGKTTADVPSKQPKPTILNHSLGLLNLKKHSKFARTNGERKHATLNDNGVSKPTKSLNYTQPNRPAKPTTQHKGLNSGNVPCYMSKLPDFIKAQEMNGGRPVADFTVDKSEVQFDQSSNPVTSQNVTSMFKSYVSIICC